MVRSKRDNTFLTNGFAFSAETLVLAVLGSIRSPAYAEQVVHRMGVGSTFPLTHANVHRHVRKLCIDGYLDAKLPESGRPLIMYTVNDKGKERLVAERAKVLKIADLIDLTVPP